MLFAQPIRPIPKLLRASTHLASHTKVEPKTGACTLIRLLPSLGSFSVRVKSDDVSLGEVHLEARLRLSIEIRGAERYLYNTRNVVEQLFEIAETTALYYGV